MCPAHEMKNRKRAKVARMRHRLACVNVHAEVVELPSVEDKPQIEPVKREEAETHGDLAGKIQKTVESIEPPVSEDQAIALEQPSLTIKNTFIHVEFPDIPQASSLPAEDVLVVTAGVLFKALYHQE